MARKEYDTFLLQDPSTFPDDREAEIIVRDLNPADRRDKYRSFFAKARISKSPDVYPDVLRLRLGRGQLLPYSWSVKILEEVNKFK